MYLSRLANSLSLDPQYEVWYVDYKYGLTTNLLDLSYVHQIVYKEPFEFPIKEPVTLVVPIYCASHIPQMHPDSKILFVNWHNYCIQAFCDIWRPSEESLQEFLRMVHRTQSVTFVDRAHWLAQNSWIKPNSAYKFSEQYVPLTIGERNLRSPSNLICTGEIHLGILGRLCDDKIYTVINLLKQLDSLPTLLEKHLHVIGEGDKANLLYDVIKEIKSVKVHMVGTITGNYLSQYLSSHVDILFGMGLSILEGAAIGLPSVIAPHNVVPFSSNAYVLLNNSRGYALGWYDSQIEDMAVPVNTLEEIVNMVYLSNRKSQLGELAIQYIRTHHSDNLQLFQLYLENTQLRYQEFHSFASKQGIIRILGIPIAKLRSSFDENEKFVDLLWIKNFFCSIKRDNKKEFILMGHKQNIITAKKVGDSYRLFICGIRIPFLKL